MNTQPLSPTQLETFDRDGFIIVPNLLDPEETQLLLQAARGDQEVHQRAFGIEDAAGRQSKLSLWNHPGDDIWGMVARSCRIVDAMEQVLGGEVYHYHSKLMLKEPRVGGAWEWHQDYGYWYQNGCLFPYMASYLIALDRATQENGCLQVLRGSHHMGRIEHGRYGQQVGADPERVKVAMDHFELVHCELEPGAGILFHSNLLHASAPNTSERSRWSLICCYNAARNNPYKQHHHPCYTPLNKVPDSAIKQVGLKLTADIDGKNFIRPEEDKTTVGAQAKPAS